MLEYFVAGDWVRKAVEENMGSKPEDRFIREEPPKILPDFNFKFSEKTKLRLESDTIPDTSNLGLEADTSPQSDGTPSVDKRFFEISLDRPTGIEFATDLSLRSLLLNNKSEFTPHIDTMVL